MIKHDKIFYLACGLPAVGLVLALFGYGAALLLFVAAYLLRPTLHEFGIARQYAGDIVSFDANGKLLAKKEG